MDARLFILNLEKDPTEAARIAAESAKRIENKELKLLDIVQSLGEYLTDNDKTVRSKAIAYLSTVLDSLNVKALSRQYVSVICQFLCGRLEDETGLKETLQGLIALQKMQRFGNDEAVTVASALCKVDLHKHPQGTRFVVLTLLNELMSTHRLALKSIGDSFLTGLVDLFGGEKDPRNLMIVFSVVKVILVEFDIVKHVELLFDVVYCYFPITFRPPPDDPYGITAQDLKLRLRECIASTKYFAAQVFPQLIEKLDSTLISVKKDVLQTITACVRSYGPQKISIYSGQLWDAVKFEIFNSSDEDELVTEALLVNRAIAETLSFGLVIAPPVTSSLARYLKEIVKECLKLLQEPQQKQSKPAGQILATVATASAVAYTYIIQNTIPALLLIYSEAEGIAKRKALLEVLSLLLESTSKTYGTWGDMTVCRAPPVENSLGEFREKLFEMYSQALMGSSKEEAGFRMAALRGLVLLSECRNLLEENEVGMVVQYLDEVALEVQGKEELREEALQSLRDISRQTPNLIMSITFPAFMAQLPDGDVKDSQVPYTTLEALAKLSTGRAVFEVLLTRLLNKLEAVLHAECSPAYPRAILSTLLYVLQKMPERGLEDTKAHFARLVPSLLAKITLPLIGLSVSSKIMADDSVLDVVGRLINILIRPLNAEQQTSIAEQIFNLFILGMPCGYIPVSSRGEVAERFRPFQADAEAEHTGCVIVFAYALAAFRPEVTLRIESLTEFLRQNVQLAIQPGSPAHRLGHLQVIGLLANKWIKPPTSSQTLQKITHELLKPVLDADFADFSVLMEERLRVAFWIAKALVLRGDKLGMAITEKLVKMLENPKYGATASKGFAALLGENDFLSKENYAAVRLLTKQRIFAFCVPKIVDGFKGAHPGVKLNYLIALSNILPSVPSAVILTELRNILPLLMQSLDMQDPNVKAATIETIFVTIKESADALKEHVSSLISRLLTACTDREKNPPKVRVAALKSVAIFPGAFSNELLLPSKRQVLRKLMSALDDPKRNVRKEAVDCRAKWFAMDEPGV